MRVIKKQSVVTKEWSGGTTKELYIYPEESSYLKRNFTYRVSTATVDVEESAFTSLPGYNRYLMILDGVMYIDHKNQHHIEMKPFDIDIFDGSWETTSKGKVIDFNLMTSNECDGILNYHKNFDVKEFKNKNDEHKIIYIYKGKVQINDIYDEGDVLILDNNEIINITNISDETILVEATAIF